MGESPVILSAANVLRVTVEGPVLSRPGIGGGILHVPLHLFTGIIAPLQHLRLQKLQHIFVYFIGLFLLHPVTAVRDTLNLNIIHPLFKTSSKLDAEGDILLAPDKQRRHAHLKLSAPGSTW